MKKTILTYGLYILMINLSFAQAELEVESTKVNKAANFVAENPDQPTTFTIERLEKIAESDVLLELKTAGINDQNGRYIEATDATGTTRYRLSTNGSVKSSGPVVIGDVDFSSGDELYIIDHDNDGDAIIRTKTDNHTVIFGANISNEGILGTTTKSKLAIRTDNVNRLVISDTGDVGIGTSAPDKKLVVRESGTDDTPTIVGVLESPISNRPALLFSEGGTIQSSGISIEYDGNLSGNNKRLQIIAPDGDKIAEFKASGSLGVNSDASNNDGIIIKQKFGIDQHGLTIFHQDGSNRWSWTVDDYDLGLYHNGVIAGSFATTSGVYTTLSDRKLKTNIEKFESGTLSKVMSLNPVRYNFKSDLNGQKCIGFIAQEVQEIFPHLAHEINSDGEKILGLSYGEFSVIAIKAIQEQQLKIESLEDEISSLKDLSAELLSLKAELQKNISLVENK